MSAVSISGIKSHEFVYIFPWLQAEAKDASPWYVITLKSSFLFRIGQDGQMLQNIKDHFANAIIIDDVNGFDNVLLTPFKERITANGITVDQLNLVGIVNLK